MILRRVLAAMILFAFAIGSSLYWADWTLDPRTLAVNCIVAVLGLVLLHFRWRAGERKIVTPKQGKDTFS